MRLQPLTLPKAPPLSSPPVLPQGNFSPLSVVNEDAEISSSDKTLTQSKTSLCHTGSTLKASSHSDFETDSLEAHGVNVAMTTSETRTATENARQAGVSVQVSPSFHSPPGQALGPASNLMVTYAMRDGSVPLSPIWNQMQYLRTDTETSSNSDYITSYVGLNSPLPHVRAPEPPNRRLGIDSGKGQHRPLQGHHVSSHAVIGHHGLLLAIMCHHMPLLVIMGYYLPSWAVTCRYWSSWAITCHHGPSQSIISLLSPVYYILSSSSLPPQDMESQLTRREERGVAAAVAVGVKGVWSCHSLTRRYSSGRGGVSLERGRMERCGRG